MLNSAEINQNKRSHKSSLRVNTECVNLLCTRSLHISRLVSQAAKNLLEKTTQLCIHSLSQRVSDAFQSNESFNNVTPGVVYIPDTNYSRRFLRSGCVRVSPPPVLSVPHRSRVSVLLSG